MFFRLTQMSILDWCYVLSGALLFFPFVCLSWGIEYRAKKIVILAYSCVAVNSGNRGSRIWSFIHSYGELTEKIIMKLLSENASIRKWIFHRALFRYIWMEFSIQAFHRWKWNRWVHCFADCPRNWKISILLFSKRDGD